MAGLSEILFEINIRIIEFRSLAGVLVLNVNFNILEKTLLFSQWGYQIYQITRRIR
jgi:hypothetical protein